MTYYEADYNSVPPVITQERFNRILADFWSMVEGFTPSGTFVNPCTYTITQSAGVASANNAYQTLYGGTGDAGGVDGDDLEAVIQAVLTNITSGKIFIRNGNWPVASGLTVSSKNNVELVLEGGCRLYRSNVAASYHLLDVQSCNRFTLSGGYIDGVVNDTTEAVGEYLSNSVHVEDCDSVIIKNVYFNIASDDAVWIEDCDKVLVEGNTFYDFYKHAVGVVSTGTADKSNDVRIIGNTVDGQNNQYYDGITVYGYSMGGITIAGNTCRNLDSAVAADHSGIHVEDPNATPDNSVITITGNTVIDSKYGITTATCRPVTITGNSIYDTSSAGIFLFNPVDITCTSNTIQTSAKGIYAVHGANINLSHNTITDITGIGIHLHQTTGNGMLESIVHGNVLENITGDGIYANASYHLNIEGNMLKKIGENGISTLRLLKSIVKGNIIVDSSQTTNNTYYSIKLSGSGGSSYYVTVTNNHCYAVAANKAKYHIYADGDCNSLHITHNMLNGGVTGNLYSTATATFIRFNKGYINEKQGVATILSGNSTVDVNPGLDSSIDFTAAAPHVLLTGQHFEVQSIYWGVKDADEIIVGTADGVVSDNRSFNYSILAANAIEP